MRETISSGLDLSGFQLVANLSKEVTVEEVNAAVKAAAEGPMKGILEYCDDPIVSGDLLAIRPHLSSIHYRHRSWTVILPRS